MKKKILYTTTCTSTYKNHIQKSTFRKTNETWWNKFKLSKLPKQ